MSADRPRERLVLGSRRSDLARTQAERVARKLRSAWPGLEVEIEWITTTGDRVLDRPLPEVGGKGLFTAELEAGLLAGEVDLAVHSLKDLPTDLGEEFSVLGVPERADPRDVLMGPEGPTELDALPSGAVVGTSSLRRAAQLRARRPDCTVESLRGNVGTRVEKVREGPYDAAILAAAGLLRLGLIDPDGAAFLEPPGWLPAPGQGALGVEGRSGDAETARRVERLEDRRVRAAVAAERSLLATLQGGCLVPIGALGRVEGETLSLDAVLLSPDGETELRASGEGDPGEAADLGRRVAEDLLEQGAGPILERVESGEELP